MQELLMLIEKLNADENVHGILVQAPLPKHIDEAKIFASISEYKDVDGFNPISVGNLSLGRDAFVPCTPYGVMKILEHYDIEIEGKNAVVIGRSNIVGKPMYNLLLQKNATVTMCHSRTKDIASHTKNADIVVAAVGIKNFVKPEMLKDGAVVIDVGINREVGSKKIYGDVDFEECKNKCSYITPVPGGVGPMTIMMLMQNTLYAKERSMK